jgi:hypothetical protein
MGMVTVTSVFSVQYAKPHAFFGPDRPARFVSLDIIFGPCRETTAFRARWIFHARGRVRFDVAGIKGPAKKSAHRIKEVPGLRWRVGPAVATGDDMLALDCGCHFVAGLPKYAVHDVFTLAPGSK